MLLIVVAAPLIALGNGGVALLSALPGRLRLPLGRALASPWFRRMRSWLFAIPVTTAVHGLVVWLWQAPALYEAALADPLVHYLEHLTMFGTVVLFWWSATTAWWRTPLGPDAGVGTLFLTMLHSGLLGILITLASLPLYPSYAAAAPFASLSPLEDQQVAGIIMLSGGFAYLAGGLALLALWLASALCDSASGEPVGIAAGTATAPHRQTPAARPPLISPHGRSRQASPPTPGSSPAEPGQGRSDPATPERTTIVKLRDGEIFRI